MKKTALVFALCCCAGIISAQQLNLSNEYFINKYAVSPAYSGHNNNFEGFLGYRNSWLGVSGSPEQRMININGPVFKDMGAGGMLVIDHIGIYRFFRLDLSYAYHYKINELMDARFGLSAGVLESTLDMGSANGSTAMTDPVALNNASAKGRMFDMNFGAVFQYENLHVGFIIPQLLEGKTKDASNTLYTMKRHYIGHISYSYAFHRDWTVDPFAAVRMTSNSTLNYEAAALVKYRQMVWAGINYRAGGSYGLTLGGLPYYDWLTVSYSFEMGSGMLGYSSGTHEITVGFRMGSKKNNITSIFPGGSGSAESTAPSYFD